MSKKVVTIEHDEESGHITLSHPYMDKKNARLIMLGGFLNSLQDEKILDPLNTLMNDLFGKTLTELEDL